MKIKNMLLLVAVSLFPTLAEAKSTACAIVVVSPHPFCVGAARLGLAYHNYYGVNRVIYDTDGLANMNAARCLERAQEYQNWCGDGNLIKPSYTVSYFQVNGANRAAGVSVNNKTYVHDGVARYTRFHD